MQDTYLQSMVEIMPVKRRCKTPIVEEHDPDEIQETPDVPDDERPNNRPRKSYSYKYHLKVNGIFTQVCRDVFLTVFGISDNRIKRINKCSSLHKNTVDMRGKMRSGNSVPGDVCIRIHQHIERFEVHETHYGGKQKKIS